MNTNLPFRTTVNKLGIRTSFPKSIKGIAVLEFSIASLAFFITFFACLEMSRMMWMTNNLSHMTRLGARLASVCQPNDPDIFTIAAENSNMTGHISSDQMKIEYLSENYTVVANPLSNILNIDFVRVEIPDFPFDSVFSLFDFSIPLPSQKTIVPSENLGAIQGVGFYDC